jgi:hypothetical protein
MAGAGFHSIAKLCAQIHNAVLADRGVFQADCHRENCRTADCYSQRTEFEQCCGSGRFLTGSGSDFRKRSDPDPDPNKFSANFLSEFFFDENML